MADIRINALATTATSAASDDYIALDGSANGTRKILASNIAQNVSDVVLGTSGPSVKSSLDARAARQGLVFDGTSAATVSVPAFGTSDFTLSAWLYTPAVNAFQFIFSANANGPQFGIMPTTGTLRMTKAGVINLAESTGTIPVGKWVHVAYSRSAGSGTYYINGVSAGTITDTQDYSTALISLSNSANLWLTGALSGTNIYNRALSASEVVSLFEAGVPSGADYNSASNTSINTSACIDGNYGAGFTGASATGFTASAASGSKFALGQPYSAVSPNQRFRVSGTLTLNAGKTIIPTVDIAGSSYVSLASGAFSVELVSTVYSAGTAVVFRTTGDANYTISGLSITRLGLLLAPDAAQAGGGTTWYDTSGNAANITLPASGVSWNVPASGYLNLSKNLTVGGYYYGNTGTAFPGALSSEGIRFYPSTSGSGFGGVIYGYGGTYDLTLANRSGSAALTIGANTTNVGVSGNLTVSGTGNSSTAGGWYVSGSTVSPNNVACVDTSFQTTYGKISAINRGVGNFPLSLNPEGGNIWINKAADSANGALQLATHTTSAGGIGFGTDVSLWRNAAGVLATNASDLFVTGTSGGLWLAAAGTYSYGIYNSGNAVTIKTNSATALTLDSSQNATFAGTITQTQAAAGSTANLKLGETGVRDWGFYATGGKMSIRPSSAGTWSFNGNTAVEMLSTLSVTGAVSIGNTVTAAVSVASTHKVTISIGGTTYYLLASNV